MASRPTTKRRKGRQKIKERYAKAREDAQLAGVIAVAPEGAVRNERVDPATQDEQRFPGLDRMAIREDVNGGWRVPAHVKRKVIEKAAEVIFEVKTGFDKDGNEIRLPPNRLEEAQASRTLLSADKEQHERDHPDDKKPQVNVGVQVNNVLDWAQVTGEKALDPAEQRLKELDEQIENRGNDAEKEPKSQADQALPSEVG